MLRAQHAIESKIITVVSFIIIGKDLFLSMNHILINYENIHAVGTVGNVSTHLCSYHDTSFSIHASFIP